MKTVIAPDGTSIAFERSGAGSPLVLVHGTTADHTRWDPVRPVLEEHFSVYAMDRRGRGSSGDSAEYSLEHEVNDIVTLVESIKEPVILLGHSFGALCALEAARCTTNIARSILYEPAFPIGEHELYDEATVSEMRSLLEDGRNEDALVFFFTEIGNFTKPELDALRTAPNWHARISAAHTVLRETEVERDYEFDPDRFESITVPTLLLTGSESPRFLRDGIAAVDGAVPNSQIMVFEGHGHVAQNTAPEMFVSSLLEFIESTE